jgi:hypothetical protein
MIACLKCVTGLYVVPYCDTNDFSDMSYVIMSFMTDDMYHLELYHVTYNAGQNYYKMYL